MDGYRDMSEATYGWPLKKVRVIDTETTGLNPNTDEILSLAILDGNGNRLFYSLIKPRNTRSWPDAERINGIGWKDVKHSPTIDAMLGKIKKLLGGDVLVVGYNVDFDLRFLRSAGVLPGSGISRLDVMELYRSVKPAGGRARLVDCAAHFGYVFPAHNALEDAKATAFCYRKLIGEEDYNENKAGELKRGGLPKTVRSEPSLLETKQTHMPNVEREDARQTRRARFKLTKRAFVVLLALFVLYVITPNTMSGTIVNVSTFTVALIPVCVVIDIITGRNLHDGDTGDGSPK